MLRSKVADLTFGTITELFLEETVTSLVLQTWLWLASLDDQSFSNATRSQRASRLNPVVGRATPSDKDDVFPE